MSGNQMAREAKKGFTRSINHMLGPRAVFVWGFLENPGMVAAVTQSSKALIDAMLSKVKWDQSKEWQTSTRDQDLYTRF